MTIQLRFSREQAISSNVIAWFTQGHYSHVDVLMPSGLALGARTDKVGGQEAGVRLRPRDYAKFVLATTFELAASEEQERVFYGLAMEQVGKPYDYTAIWGFALGRDWRDSKAWYCSELAVWLCECAGLIRPLVCPAYKISPDMAVVVVSAIGQRVLT